MQEGTQTALLPTAPTTENQGEGVSSTPTPSSWKPKFPRRRNGIYYIDGGEYLSVTEILSVLSKPGLVNWAARTAASLVLADPEKYDTASRAAGGIYGIRDDAAERGSTVHSLVEALFRGADVNVDGIPDHLQGYYRAFAGWREVVDPTPLYAEATVYSPTHGFAGQLDLVCALPSGRMILCDIKTGGLYPEFALQLEAYRNAEYILPKGDNPKPIPMPPIAHCWIVSLKPDGGFEHREVLGDFEVFLAVKRAYEWRQRAEREMK